MKKTSMKIAVVLSALTVSIVLSGCGLGTSASQAISPSVQTSGLRGMAHGGQQPITGASVQLYVAGTTGYGTAATSLNAQHYDTTTSSYIPVTTDMFGVYWVDKWDTGSCPAGGQVYLLASGGDPGIGSGVNSSADLLSTLGTCADLVGWNKGFIVTNEISTVAAAYALSPFMVDATHVGTSSTNTAGLASAFASSANLVGLNSGQPNTGVSGVIVPGAKIISIANALGTCVNSAGASSAGCSTLFSKAGSGSATETVGAAVQIAKNPGSNVGSIFGNVTPNVAFDGGLTSQPNDLTLAVQYTNGLAGSPKGVTVDAAGDLWVPNGTTVTELSSTGTIISPSPYTGFTTPVAVAIDASGTAWVADKGANALGKIAGGSVVFYTGTTTGDLNAPSGVVVDNAGNLWLNNSGNNTIAAFSSSGTELAGSPFSASGVTGAVGIAVTPH